MEVSHVEDHVTHAVIGAQQNIGFGISDSAEFFNILSSTLYKDQRLAVVREVLCNAWDAHIMGNCQTTPVEIKLDTEVFVIRDFGPGIHHNDIGPIYGTYGNSTKKHDGKQTGGFGLGCKAPFAYTDHFEVISWHKGTKTIYNMSKSSAMVGGKPGIQTIAQFPCGNETGLQVTIKLKASHDRDTFRQLIHRIVMNGEMNMHLNKEALPVIAFSEMKHDFLVTTRDLLANNTIKNVLLRYGNVVYPIDHNSAYGHLYEKAVEFLKGLPGTDYNHTPYKLVLQAPPHSISVTPSREELSMQEHTVNTITLLLEQFLARLNSSMEAECLTLAKECVLAAWQNKNIGELLIPTNKLPGASLPMLSKERYLTTVPQLARYHASRNYPNFGDFRRRDSLARLDKLIAEGYGNRGLLKSYRDELSRNFGAHESGRWFQEHIVNPLIRRWPKDTMNMDRLWLLGHQQTPFTNSSNQLHGAANKSDYMAPLVVQGHALHRYAPYLRNIVVLSYTKNDVPERLKMFPAIKETGGINYCLFVYHVPRFAKKVDEARAYFKGLYGVNLIDLTVAAPWEHKEIAEPVERVYVKRVKQEGWPSIMSIVDGRSLSMDAGRAETAKRIDKPEWYVWLTKRDKHHDSPQWLERFDNPTTMAILDAFGEKGAIALSTAQEQKLIAAGAIDMRKYVETKVLEEMVSNPRIEEHYAMKMDHIKHEDREVYEHKAINMVYWTKRLREQFGLTSPLTKANQGIIDLWDHFLAREGRSYHRHGPAPRFQKVIDYLEAIPAHPAVLVLQTKVYDNMELEFLNFDALSAALEKDVAKLNSKGKRAMEIIKQTFKV